MQLKKYPKITIITPSYNQGRFIQETIDSVLHQNYPNLEYWVIDGGSTDGTVDILHSYGKKINWISEKDNGQTDAINKGLARATGEIIAYLNSDDVYLPNTLNTVAEYMLNNPTAQWLTGDYFIIDEYGKKIQSFVARYKRLLRSVLSLDLLLIMNPIIQPSTFWRTGLQQKIGLFDDKLRYCMDYDYWIRASKYAPVHVLLHHFSLFRIHRNSKGGAQYSKQFTEEYDVASMHTRNLFVLLAHKLHAACIVGAYKLIK